MSERSPADDAAVDPVRRLADDLHRLEHLLRQGIALNGSLATSAAEAHAHCNLSATVGHQVFANFNQAAVELSNALTSVAHGHRLLDAIGRQLGLDVTAYGDGQKQPAPGFVADFFTRSQDEAADPVA